MARGEAAPRIGEGASTAIGQMGKDDRYQTLYPSSSDSHSSMHYCNRPGIAGVAPQYKGVREDGSFHVRMEVS